VFLLLWFPAAILSRGFPEADGCTHYLFARFAFQIPANLVNMWGRPVCTALYALPAVLGGRFGVCAASALIGIGCGLVSFQLARDSNDRSPALALIFTLAGPMLFIHSLSAMTELPFALLLSGAFLAFGRKRWGLAAMLASLLPLTRPEGFGFLLIAAVALFWRHRARWLAVLPAPLLVWDVAGWMIKGRDGPWWHWLATQWPYASHSMYGHGNPLTFVAELPIIVSPFVLPAVLLGIWRSFADSALENSRNAVLSPDASLDASEEADFDNQRRATFEITLTPALSGSTGRGSTEASGARRGLRIATALVPLFVLFVHSILYTTGRLGSYGEARYLLVAAPFWGVLSGRGWQWCFDHFQWRGPVRWAAIAALVPVLINICYPIVPLRPPPDWVMSDRVARWYAASPFHQAYPHLLCSHVGVFFALDLSPSDDSVRDWNRQILLAPPPGTMLIWDPIFGPLNADADRAVTLEEIRLAGWEEEAAAANLLRNAPSPNWHIFHSHASAQ
jgi:hypothetical protein